MHISCHTNILKNLQFSVLFCRDIFSDSASLIGPDDSTIAYGEEDITTYAIQPWEKFVPVKFLFRRNQFPIASSASMSANAKT